MNAKNGESGEVLPTRQDVIRYNCNKVSHTANKFPDREEKDKTMSKKKAKKCFNCGKKENLAMM
jgi:hypothetical protein